MNFYQDFDPSAHQQETAGDLELPGPQYDDAGTAPETFPQTTDELLGEDFCLMDIVGGGCTPNGKSFISSL